jgi:hypothetical protein
VPPPAAEVPDALNALEKFVHNDALPLLVKIGIATRSLSLFIRSSMVTAA